MSIVVPQVRIRRVAGEAYVVGIAETIYFRDPDSRILQLDTVSESFAVCVDDSRLTDPGQGLDLGYFETLEDAQAIADAWNSADGMDHSEDYEHQASALSP